MKMLRRLHLIVLYLSLIVGFAAMAQPALGQSPSGDGGGAAGGPGRPNHDSGDD